MNKVKSAKIALVLAIISLNIASINIIIAGFVPSAVMLIVGNIGLLIATLMNYRKAKNTNTK